MISKLLTPRHSTTYTTNYRRTTLCVTTCVIPYWTAYGRSANQVSDVDSELGSGDVARLVVGQERDGRCDFFRVLDLDRQGAVEYGCRSRVLRDQLMHFRCVHSGRRRSRVDGYHPDAALAQFDCE
jgi:hypothetical protein